jgi:predicted thioredoxin/glutaredoxin
MPDVMIDTIRTIDDIFLRMVASRAIQDWVVLDLDLAPLDDVVEELWAMLARGDLRLVADGERLRLARTHRPIIEARWRMLSGNPA